MRAASRPRITPRFAPGYAPRPRRERLLALVEGAGTAEPFELAKYVLGCTRAEHPAGPSDR